MEASLQYRRPIPTTGEPQTPALRIRSEQSDGEADDQRRGCPEHADPGEEPLEGAVVADALEEEDPDYVRHIDQQHPRRYQDPGDRRRAVVAVLAAGADHGDQDQRRGSQGGDRYPDQIHSGEWRPVLRGSPFALLHGGVGGSHTRPPRARVPHRLPARPRRGTGERKLQTLNGFVSRGFTRRRQTPEELADRLPPGQYAEPGYPVLTAGPTPDIPTGEWSFRIDGMVGQEGEWSWEQFHELPWEQIPCDIHCVTKWSKLGTSFGGVSLDVLLEEAEPLDAYTMVYSYGGYTTNLAIEDLTEGKAWVVTEHEGEPLPREHGGPGPP